ncbi:MAG: hypothetical protein JOY62_07085 [Acidobacteriaceae bacterium]|nr:hypothetical protein [Acidobacteriaceae bacterium]MBV9779722.1 hypothetical protein [Acidobacteriaceae bacterium]
MYENDELPGVPISEVEEVSKYVAAMNHGLQRLRDGVPLSLRLIREIQRNPANWRPRAASGKRAALLTRLNR